MFLMRLKRQSVGVRGHVVNGKGLVIIPGSMEIS